MIVVNIQVSNMFSYIMTRTSYYLISWGWSLFWTRFN